MAEKRNKGGKLQLGGGGQTEALMIILDIFIKSLLQAGNQGGNMQLEGGGQGESSNFIFNVCTEHGSGWGPGVQPCSWRWECHRRTLVARPVMLKYTHLASKKLWCKSFAKLVEWESFYFKGVREKACSPAGFLLSSCSSITKLLHKLLQLALCQQNVIINTAMESANRTEILMGRHCKRHTKPQTFGESEEGKGEGEGRKLPYGPRMK